MALQSIEKTVSVISDYFGGRKAPRGAINDSTLKQIIRSIIVRADGSYMPPTVTYGSTNIVEVLDYDKENGAVVEAVASGTGIPQEGSGSGSGISDDGTGFQFEIIDGGFEFLNIDATNGNLKIAGNIESDILNRMVTVRVTNGYGDDAEVVIDLSIKLPVVP